MSSGSDLQLETEDTQQDLLIKWSHPSGKSNSTQRFLPIVVLQRCLECFSGVFFFEIFDAKVRCASKCKDEHRGYYPHLWPRHNRNLHPNFPARVGLLIGNFQTHRGFPEKAHQKLPEN